MQSAENWRPAAGISATASISSERTVSVERLFRRCQRRRQKVRAQSGFRPCRSPCKIQSISSTRLRCSTMATRSPKLARMSRTATVLFLPGILLSLLCAAARSAGEEPASQKAADADRSARLRTMHEIVGRIELESGGGDERRPLELLPEPILRYSDVPHGLEDATVWIWRRGDRPAAL